jgi:predicted amidohydrolase YtcJ
MAISGGRIMAVGSAGAMEKYIGAETRVVKLQPGQTAMPGLIEGHGHFLGLGESLMMLNLSTAGTWNDIVDQVRIAATVTPPGEWIIGRGWHQSKWSEVPEPNVAGYPTAEALDKAAPNHPVLLTHASGHMNIVNGYAMRLASIDADTKDPAGGELLRDSAGKPTGVLRETAQGLAGRALAIHQAKQTNQQRAAELARSIELAGEQCWINGITSFQDAGTSLIGIRELRQAALAGKLPVRLWIMIRDDLGRIEQSIRGTRAKGLGNDYFTVEAIKLSIDGALGPHGAWLLAPYADMPGSTGLNTIDLDVVKKTADLAARNNFQLCVHAIGDRANRETLDIFEKALTDHPSRTSRRWRVEHAQHLHPDDISRFRKLSVIASMQGVHCTSDAIFVPQRLGMLRSEQGAYVWRSLLDSGAVVTNGTDTPVEDINPFASIYASVSRQLPNGDRFFPKQSMTRYEALRSYTIDCAYAAFEESIKGSLVPGKLADIVIIDNDLLTCPDEAILKTKVCLTVLGGKIVYEMDAGK